jgi:hypothetical protein
MFEGLFGDEEGAEGGWETSPVGVSRGGKMPTPVRGNEVPFIGLSNQGATCYLNSLVHALYFTPYFRQGLYELQEEDMVVEEKRGEQSSPPENGESRPSTAEDNTRSPEDEAQMDLLLGMGFEKSKVERAMKKYPYEEDPSGERKMEWILECNDDFDEADGEKKDGSKRGGQEGEEEEGSFLQSFGFEEGDGEDDHQKSETKKFDEKDDFHEIHKKDGKDQKVNPAVPSSDSFDPSTAPSDSSIPYDSSTPYDSSIPSSLTLPPTLPPAPKKKVREVPQALQRLFGVLEMGDVAFASTEELTASFNWKSSHTTIQHDVHELNRVLMDVVERSLKNTKKQNLVRSIFHGLQSHQIKCTECGTIKERSEEFGDLTLAIPRSGINASQSSRPSNGKSRSSTANSEGTSLETCLQHYFGIEFLEGKNQYECDTCQRKTNAEIGMRIKQLPQVLCLSLARMEYNFNTGNRVKNTGKVSFPPSIDILPFLSDDQMKERIDGHSKDATSGASGQDHSPKTDFNSSSQNDLPTSSSHHPTSHLPSTIYDLYAIIIHKGASATSGHYHAYIKDLLNLTYQSSFQEQSSFHHSSHDDFDVIEKTFEESSKTDDPNRDGSSSVDVSSTSNDDSFKANNKKGSKKSNKSNKSNQEESSKMESSIWKEMEKTSDFQRLPHLSSDGNSSSFNPASIWYDFDDTSVKRIDASSIPKLFSSTECAYMFFYKQRDIIAEDKQSSNSIGSALKSTSPFPSPFDFSPPPHLIEHVLHFNETIQLSREDHLRQMNEVEVELNFPQNLACPYLLPPQSLPIVFNSLGKKSSLLASLPATVIEDKETVEKVQLLCNGPPRFLWRKDRDHSSSYEPLLLKVDQRMSLKELIAKLVPFAQLPQQNQPVDSSLECDEYDYCIDMVRTYHDKVLVEKTIRIPSSLIADDRKISASKEKEGEAFDGLEGSKLKRGEEELRKTLREIDFAKKQILFFRRSIDHLQLNSYGEVIISQKKDATLDQQGDHIHQIIPFSVPSSFTDILSPSFQWTTFSIQFHHELKIENAAEGDSEVIHLYPPADDASHAHPFGNDDHSSSDPNQPSQIDQIQVCMPKSWDFLSSFGTVTMTSLNNSIDINDEELDGNHGDEAVEREETVKKRDWFFSVFTFTLNPSTSLKTISSFIMSSISSAISDHSSIGDQDQYLSSLSERSSSSSMKSLLIKIMVTKQSHVKLQLVQPQLKGGKSKSLDSEKKALDESQQSVSGIETHEEASKDQRLAKDLDESSVKLGFDSTCPIVILDSSNPDVSCEYDDSKMSELNERVGENERYWEGVWSENEGFNLKSLSCLEESSILINQHLQITSSKILMSLYPGWMEREVRKAWRRDSIDFLKSYLPSNPDIISSIHHSDDLELKGGSVSKATGHGMSTRSQGKKAPKFSFDLYAFIHLKLPKSLFSIAGGSIPINKPLADDHSDDHSSSKTSSSSNSNFSSPQTFQPRFLIKGVTDSMTIRDLIALIWESSGLPKQEGQQLNFIGENENPSPSILPLFSRLYSMDAFDQKDKLYDNVGLTVKNVGLSAYRTVWLEEGSEPKPGLLSIKASLFRLSTLPSNVIHPMMKPMRTERPNILFVPLQLDSFDKQGPKDDEKKSNGSNDKEKEKEEEGKEAQKLMNEEEQKSPSCLKDESALSCLKDESALSSLKDESALSSLPPSSHNPPPPSGESYPPPPPPPPPPLPPKSSIFEIETTIHSSLASLKDSIALLILKRASSSLFIPSESLQGSCQDGQSSTTSSELKSNPIGGGGGGGGGNNVQSSSLSSFLHLHSHLLPTIHQHLPFDIFLAKNESEVRDSLSLWIDDHLMVLPKKDQQVDSSSHSSSSTSEEELVPLKAWRLNSWQRSNIATILLQSKSMAVSSQLNSLVESSESAEGAAPVATSQNSMPCLSLVDSPSSGIAFEEESLAHHQNHDQASAGMVPSSCSLRRVSMSAPPSPLHRPSTQDFNSLLIFFRQRVNIDLAEVDKKKMGEAPKHEFGSFLPSWLSIIKSSQKKPQNNNKKNQSGGSVPNAVQRKNTKKKERENGAMENGGNGANGGNGNGSNENGSGNGLNDGNTGGGAIAIAPPSNVMVDLMSLINLFSTNKPTATHPNPCEEEEEGSSCETSPVVQAWSPLPHIPSEWLLLAKIGMYPYNHEMQLPKWQLIWKPSAYIEKEEQEEGEEEKKESSEFKDSTNATTTATTGSIVVDQVKEKSTQSSSDDLQQTKQPSSTTSKSTHSISSGSGGGVGGGSGRIPPSIAGFVADLEPGMEIWDLHQDHHSTHDSINDSINDASSSSSSSSSRHKILLKHFADPKVPSASSTLLEQSKHLQDHSNQSGASSKPLQSKKVKVNHGDVFVFSDARLWSSSHDDIFWDNQRRMGSGRSAEDQYLSDLERAILESTKSSSSSSSSRVEHALTIDVDF